MSTRRIRLKCPRCRRFLLEYLPIATTDMVIPCRSSKCKAMVLVKGAKVGIRRELQAPLDKILEMSEIAG